MTVVCWKWRNPTYQTQFSAETVNVLRRMVARHYPRPHRFVCVTDDPDGIGPDVEVIPLWDDHRTLLNPSGANKPSCYRRLRAFSREAAALFGPRFVSLDLDCVITGDLAPLWDRTEPFVIWGDTHPKTPYNGSMWLLTAGARAQVWEDFNPETSPKRGARLGYVGSDQAWIGACLGPGEPTWGVADGVYSWRVHLRRQGGKLPADARIVFFHGCHNPWDHDIQAAHRWVREFYQ